METLPVGDSRPGVKAEHGVVQSVVFAADVVNVVGGNDLATAFISETNQFRQDLMLFRQPVVLQFDV